MSKYLIAGLGSIGRRHMRNLLALGERDIVLLRSHKSTLPEDELAGYPVETDINEALGKHKPDAVIVSNPTALHLDVAIPAAEAGCAILLEKPISHTGEKLDTLQSAVQRTSAPVLLGFQLRFHPCLRRAREWVQAGLLGKLQCAKVHYGEYLPGWHPWEDYRQGYAARADLGGGVVATQCHSLDYLPWIAGKAEALWGFEARLSDLKLDVPDTAEIGLKLASGVLADIHLDYAEQPPTHKLEVVGDAGRLACDLLKGELLRYDLQAAQVEHFVVLPGWERNTMFMEQMMHFIRVVARTDQPSCNLQDGLRVMEMIGAVAHSTADGRIIPLVCG